VPSTSSPEHAHSNGASSNAHRLWEHHHARWRDPAQILSLWEHAGTISSSALEARVTGPWWELLDALQMTLLVTREYEHLAIALSVVDGRPRSSFLPIPHPSGLVVDRERGRVHLASTRNPNQIIELAPVADALPRRGAPSASVADRLLVPVATRFHPGALYIHELAMMDGALHANAVGENAIVRLPLGGGHERVWWPRAIETDGVPDFSRNFLQLNSIAAGQTPADSFFSASAERMSSRRPGHLNFPVDRRGVVFSGATREPVVRGLTRPHSARLHDGRLWVADSGYGRVGVVLDGRFEPVASLGCWTRGLTFCGDVAFVGGSRIIPRFRHYAPGVEDPHSRCGVTALDARSGATLATFTWPEGNQVFAVDWLPRATSHGLPFDNANRRTSDVLRLFYAFQAGTEND
jgi:uncharacterized protein (TIGR03032 family)